MKKYFALGILLLVALTGCATSQNTGTIPLAAPQSSYATKEFPVAGDKVLITDSQDSWRTKNVLFSSFPGLTSQPTADNQILQATGVGAYGWTSTLDGIGNITGAGTYNNITITQPATGATLTLSDGSSLITSGGDSITLTSTGATDVTLPTSGTLATTAQLQIAEVIAGLSMDGGGSDIPDGVKGDKRVPFAAHITTMTITSTASCSSVVDVWKDTYANFPATVADAITGGGKPTLSTATKAQITGLNIAVAAGDMIRFNVDSNDCTGIVNVTLEGTRD